MASIEENKKGTNTYLSFVKKLTFMNELFLYKKHIGRKTKDISKEEYILDNLNEIVESEFEFRKKYLDQIKNKLSHNENLPEKIEKKSIEITNLQECKNYPRAIMSDFSIKFIYNSNNIEGSKLPEEEVKKIVKLGKTDYKNKNEAREAFNSIDAFDYLDDFNFNLSSIKRLYNILTKNLVMENGNPYPKGFKKINIIINNSQTTPPEKVEKELLELLNWYKENKKKIHPLILALDFHLRYEQIHPFRDGNGRTGRMIMNKILMQNKYPPIIVYKENKSAYFNSMAKASEGRKKKYYQFMLGQANKSYDYILGLFNRY
ncbi:Fic family protein [Candidatus Pacearchaeota archaeon]|nr:Fic family protein [Candidatus Pacearchaeota archaeon]